MNTMISMVKGSRGVVHCSCESEVMLQQLLMMTAASDMQRDHDGGEGEEDNAKPPAR
jgi:hypothetical protein